MKHQTLKIQLKIYFIQGRFCSSDTVDDSGGGVWGDRGTEGRQKNQRETRG